MALAVAALMPIAVGAQLNILTNRYDQARTGANLVETTLTVANVTAARFGKVGSYAVDGAVYAQPLYASGLTVNGQVRNVLYVATMNDKVYAFDADRPSTPPLWSRDFTSPPAVTPVPITDIARPNLNIVGNVGIQSTPVIDAASGTIYLVARTKESGQYVQRLHALDIRTGQSRPGSPVTIAGSVPGTALDSTVANGQRVITFDPKVHVQRAALAITNGVVLVSWAAHEDLIPSHGWIMAFNTSTLARTGIMTVTPDVYGGGIWQGGRAPAIDPEGYVYIATGNAPWDGVRNFGDTLLKLRVSRTEMTIVDYFTPSNHVQLNLDDDDLSGSGFTLLPGTRLLLGGGKEGVLYLLNADNLGHQAPGDTQIVQRIPYDGGHVMGGPVFWNSANSGPMVYNWSEDNYLTAYRLSGGRLSAPAATGAVKSPGHPGGSLTVSANGSAANSGIIWASIPATEDAIHGLHAGILRAYDAETLAQIWTSEQQGSRDRLGTLMKFVPPVVARGRVYLPNHDGAVHVYGLLAQDFTIGVSPASRSVAPGASATFTVTVAPVAGFTGRVDLRATGQPAGTSIAFSPAFLTASGSATMTVSVPASAPAGSFAATVTGTSGGVSHTAAPVSVTVDTPAAVKGAIGVDFVGTGTPMASSEAAGVVPISHWNAASGASRSTPLALLDGSGAASGASVTWVSNNTWSTLGADQPGNARMMKGYLDTTSTSSSSVTVSGLVPRAYDVYVYADGANSGFARTAAYRLNGNGITSSTTNLTDAANATFSGVFVAANDSTGNYVKFSIVGTGFTLTATPFAATTATMRAPINGIEIVPTGPAAPERRTVSIDFTGAGAMTMAPAETAGVVAATHWNAASGTSRSTPLVLVDNEGSASGARLTWDASSTWVLPITDQPGNRRMMAGYLDTSSVSSTTVTLSGLGDGLYDVYVYVDGDNRSYTRTGAYSLTVAGAPQATVHATDMANVNFSSAFTAAANGSGNYIRFRIDGTGFTLRATPLSGSNTTLRAPINGLQIVPVAP